MTGETDLGRMLATLSVSRRPGDFVVASIPSRLDAPVLSGEVVAVIAEDEGTTVVAIVEAAEANGWSYDGRWAWLSLDVHSSLQAVGLTAAMAAALTAADLPANVIAGYHHDHLLVPSDRVDDAVAALTGLRRNHQRARDQWGQHDGDGTQDVTGQ